MSKLSGGIARKETPASTGQRASKTKSIADKDIPEAPAREAVECVAIQWPADLKERRKFLAKWFDLIFPRLDGPDLKTACYVFRNFMVKSLAMHRSDERIAADLGVHKRTVQRGLDGMRTSGVLVTSKIYVRGNGGKIIAGNRHVTLCVPIEFAAEFGVTEPTVLSKQRQISHSSDRSVKAVTDGGAHTYEKRPSEKRPSEKRQQEDAVFDLRFLSDTQIEVFNSIVTLHELESIRQSTDDPVKAQSPTFAFNALRARFGFAKGSPEYAALTTAMRRRLSELEAAESHERTERDAKAARMVAARKLTASDHFERWKATWSEPRPAGEFCEPDAFEGIEPKKMEAHASRLARNDFHFRYWLTFDKSLPSRNAVAEPEWPSRQGEDAKEVAAGRAISDAQRREAASYILARHAERQRKAAA